MCVHFADPSSDCCSSFCHDAYSLSSSSFSHCYNSINTPMQHVHEGSQNSEMALASFFRNISHGTQLAICIQKNIHVCISICKYIYTCISFCMYIYIKVTYLFLSFSTEKKPSPHGPWGDFLVGKRGWEVAGMGSHSGKLDARYESWQKRHTFFAAWCTFRLKQEQSKPLQFF